MSEQRISNKTMKEISERQCGDDLNNQCITDSMGPYDGKSTLHQTVAKSNDYEIAASGGRNDSGYLATKQTVASDSVNLELARSQEILRDNANESNRTTADAFSNSLADMAMNATSVDLDLNRTYNTVGGDSSSSSGGGIADAKSNSRSVALHISYNQGSSRTSGSSDDAGTASRHVVTTTPGGSTQTGSSGDDRESSKGSGSTGGKLSAGDDTGAMSSENGIEQANTHAKRGHYRHRRHHRYHRSHRPNTVEKTTNDDGSALKLPGDDLSDRLSTGPATVVASRMSPPRTDSNTTSSADNHDGLFQPHHEPGYYTIRKTFSGLPKNARATKSEKRTERSSSGEQQMEKYIKDKHGFPKTDSTVDDGTHNANKKKRSKSENHTKKQRGRGLPSHDSDASNEANGEESSSGSGTEGGYMGSADSKENESSSSASISSFEVGRQKKKSKKRHRVSQDDANHGRARGARTENSGDSSSSEIADFSSGSTSENDEDRDAFQSASPSLSSSNEDEGGSSEDGYDASLVQAGKNQIFQSQEHMLATTTRRRKVVIEEPRAVDPKPWPKARIELSNKAAVTQSRPQTPILSVGSDVMAHVLTFLQPPKILDVLTMPLSKDWRQTFTLQPEMWRVLCLVEPFKAEIHDDDLEDADDSSSINSFCSMNVAKESRSRLLDKYRLLYSSFVRCMKYLSQIREDALSGRAPTYIDCGISSSNAQQGRLMGEDRNLQSFLTQAKVTAKGGCDEVSSEENSASDGPQQVVAGVASIPKKEDSNKRKRSKSKSRDEKLKTGRSMITDRLLGPSASGEPGHLQLPWSCAIYSIVNWMVSFTDVEGIQTLCMKVLPFLLENEQQRQTAQRAGLTDIVLKAMVLFPDSVQLHIAAFHTIVLLARPLGGREGMLFHSSMILTGIFGGHSPSNPKSGIAVMVESMKRFEDNDVLQAMSCWALVNIALAPAQKAELVKLGGIEATSNAMRRHPFSAEVQFRALFALINLVIPSVRLDGENADNAGGAEQIRDAVANRLDTSEKEMIDKSVSDIVSLVVRSMKNFCSSEAILNRACLVLHNLSLTHEYHSAILWTPNCYQMLEWCLGNYRSDQVLQQSASGALNRLQMTLSSDDDLRTKFTAELQSQQQASLYQAHQEALRLQNLQEEVNGA